MIASSASVDVTLCEWDGVSSGLDIGLADNLTWKNMGDADEFETSTTNDLSSPNSFKYHGDSEGYWNLTEDYTHIESINLSFIVNKIVTGNLIRLKFYDSADVNVITLGFYKSSTGTPSLRWQNRSDLGSFVLNSVALIGNTVLGARYYINISHYGTNWFNVTALDSTFNVVAYLNRTGVSSSVFTSFSYVYFESAGSNTDDEIYFDNFYIRTEDGAVGGFQGFDHANSCNNPISGYDQMCYPDPDVEGCHFDMGCLLLSPPWLWGRCVDCDYSLIPVKYIEWQSDIYITQTINDVILPVSAEQVNFVSFDPNDYSMVINGGAEIVATSVIHYGNDYAIFWDNVAIDVVDEKILFAFSCDALSTLFVQDWYWYGIGIFYGGNGRSLVHNENSLFTNGVFDGNIPGNMQFIICWDYSASDFTPPDPPPEDNPTIIDDYDNEFGNATTGGDTQKGYIEFAVFDQECDYRVGESPAIVYNLSGFIGDDTVKRCLYRIWQIGNGTHDVLVFNDYIDISDDWRRGYRDLTNRFAFSSSGSYYIIIYNTTDNGNTLSEFIHRSGEISVCDVPDDDAIPGQTGTDPSTDPFDFSDIPVLFKVIISLFIIIILTVSPYFFASMINKGRVQIQMPSLVYVAFFFIGVVASIMLRFLEIWVFFVILVGLILTIVVFWLQGKDISSGGE